jgi:hypothetical protein
MFEGGVPGFIGHAHLGIEYGNPDATVQSLLEAFGLSPPPQQLYAAATKDSFLMFG